METEKIETKENQTSVESFDKIINESKDSLAAESAAQIKRGRGRPSGAKNVKGRESEKKENIEDVPKLEPGVNPTLPPLDLKPVLKDATKLPFSVAALKFKNPELEITDIEAETPAFYLNRVLNNYMPELERQNPKLFAVYAWFISIILLGLKKAVVFVENKKNNLKTVQSSANPNQADDSEPLAPVPVQATHSTAASTFFNSKGKF
ncbi:MAG: hypothetical protein ACK41T_01055 [Pseudobdellovibrio sp.]